VANGKYVQTEVFFIFYLDSIGIKENTSRWIYLNKFAIYGVDNLLLLSLLISTVVESGGKFATP
jgi:hypothetical protein